METAALLKATSRKGTKLCGIKEHQLLKILRFDHCKITTDTKNAPVQFCPSQIPSHMNWKRTQIPAVGTRDKQPDVRKTNDDV